MSDLSVLIKPLMGLLDTFRAERHYKDDKKEEALLAINKALIETRLYLEASKGEKCYDREKEGKLAHLWAEASIKSKNANRELVGRLHDKSLYWTDQLKWSREEVLDRGIDLDSIQEQLNKLLKA